MSRQRWGGFCTKPSSDHKSAIYSGFPKCAFIAKHRAMTNVLALWLGAIIIAIFAVDALFLNLDLHIIVGRQFLRILEWVAFWR